MLALLPSSSATASTSSSYCSSNIVIHFHLRDFLSFNVAVMLLQQYNRKMYPRQAPQSCLPITLEILTLTSFVIVNIVRLGIRDSFVRSD